MFNIVRGNLLGSTDLPKLKKSSEFNYNYT